MPSPRAPRQISDVADARTVVDEPGAEPGAIAAVLGAYFVLYPGSTVRGLFIILPVRVSAWFFLGFWFLYQLVEANFGMFAAGDTGGGVAFFAYVGGFIFGVVVAFLLMNAGSSRRRLSPGGWAHQLDR